MGDTPPAANVLTDRLLRSWLRCRRKAWLDRHGDATKRRWTAHRNLMLDDQQRCFVALMPQKPAHGQAGCEAGAAGVVGLRLKGRGPVECCWRPIHPCCAASQVAVAGATLPINRCWRVRAAA